MGGASSHEYVRAFAGCPPAGPRIRHVLQLVDLSVAQKHAREPPRRHVRLRSRRPWSPSERRQGENSVQDRGLLSTCIALVLLLAALSAGAAGQEPGRIRGRGAGRRRSGRRGHRGRRGNQPVDRCRRGCARASARWSGTGHGCARGVRPRHRARNPDRGRRACRPGRAPAGADDRGGNHGGRQHPHRPPHRGPADADRNPRSGGDRREDAHDARGYRHDAQRDGRHAGADHVAVTRRRERSYSGHAGPLHPLPLRRVAALRQPARRPGLASDSADGPGAGGGYQGGGVRSPRGRRHGRRRQPRVAPARR